MPKLESVKSHPYTMKLCANMLRLRKIAEAQKSAAPSERALSLRAAKVGTKEEVDLVIVNVFNNDEDAFMAWALKSGVRVPPESKPAEPVPPPATDTPSGVPQQPTSSDAPAPAPGPTITPLVVPGA